MSPLREDGASACHRDPVCSVSRVSLLLEPTQEYGASAYKHLSCSKAPVTLLIDPSGEERLDPLAALCLQWFCPRSRWRIKERPLISFMIPRMYIHVEGWAGGWRPP